MLLSKQHYSNNESIDSIEYDAKNNTIEIYIFDENNESPYKSFKIDSNDSIIFSEKTLDFETTNNQNVDYQKLEEFGIDTTLIQDVLKNNNAKPEIEQSDLPENKFNKTINSYHYSKADNQIVLQLTSNESYSEDNSEKIQETFTINSDGTANYTAGDSISQLENSDLTKKQLVDLLVNKNINHDSVLRTVQDIDNSILNYLKNTAIRANNKLKL